MKVAITLDYWNGQLSKSKIIDEEELTGQPIIFALLEAGVAGVTITKCNSLKSIITHLNKPLDNH
jgi:hypothetical protein